MRWSKATAFLAAGILLAAVGPSASQPQDSQPQPAQSPSAQPAASPTATPAQGATPAPSPVQQLPPPGSAQAHTFFVMIDPSHGGDDRGAAFPHNLAEKDVTLALARRLKSELQERGISARLLRDTDVTLSLEQRAETANEQHAAVYVALHAGMPGGGVRVYTPALASLTPAVAGKFPLWENAQANSLPRSEELAQRITVEMGKRNVAAQELATPVRPLNNVVAPAVAIELAPDPDNIPEIMAQKFQTAVAASIASGIAQLRPQWEGQP